MRDPQGKWHPNWLIDTLLRLGLITLLTWIAIILALYLGSMGEAIPSLPGEPVPQATVTATPPTE